MKNTFLPLLIIIFAISTSYAQNGTKTLINDKLDELFINKDNPYGEIPAKTVDKLLVENSNIYFFEIVYNDRVLFREGIDKSIPRSKDSEIMANQFRFKYDRIYLDADLISDADKLKLLESYKNKIVDIAGKKLIELKDLTIIEKDYKMDKFVILNPLESMKINIYKFSFN